MDGELHVLVVNASWGWYEEEGIDIHELVEGMRATVPPGAMLYGTDGRSVFAIAAGDGARDVAEPLGTWAVLRRVRIDVAHIHMVVPFRHLLLGLRLRLRGIPVVCSPMGMLGRDFAASSWFRHRHRVWPGLRRGHRVRQRLKPMQVAVWRTAWRVVADHFVCPGSEEMRQADLPPERCSLVPFPAPRSELAESVRQSRAIGPAHSTAAVTAAPAVPAVPAATRDADPTAPIAMISRFDPYRKGFDRAARWLSLYAQELTAPALRVFVPRPGSWAEVDEVMRSDLVDWDADTRGAALAPLLQRCRGVLLLSRWEGQPRVLREAALLGLPTLSTMSANFAEVVALLGSGAVVDGDRPADVHAAFRALPDHPHHAIRARLVFDRDRIGAYLWELLEAVATSAAPPPSYYDVLADAFASTSVDAEVQRPPGR